MCSIRYFSEQCCAEQERGGARNSVGNYPYKVGNQDLRRVVRQVEQNPPTHAPILCEDDPITKLDSEWANAILDHSDLKMTTVNTTQTSAHHCLCSLLVSRFGGPG